MKNLGLKLLVVTMTTVTMTIVTIMLALILGLLYLFTALGLAQDSIHMMETIAKNPFHIAPPDMAQENIRLPYFSVVIGPDGEPVGFGGGFFDLSDEELLRNLLKAANEGEEDIGVLKEYDLRYLRSDTPRGQCVVFADITSEKATLRNLLKTDGLIGLAAFSVFLGISILLSRWAIKPVERAWQEQKQFVADASHELKTPLTVIMTDAELLHAPGCTEQEREQLSGSIIAMSVQMRGLVENLLELARMDNGSVKEPPVQVSLSEIASTASMMFEPVLFEKGYSFDSEIKPELMVKGNPTQLKQLLDIFLDNAGKYTAPGGKIILRVRSMPHKQCLVEVANEGTPLTPEELKDIFKRFYRGDKVRSMNHSYGLGLSIAQSIVEEHHGRIWAESAEGTNRFYVELPVK